MQESFTASLVRSLVSVIAVVLLIVSSMGTAGCALTHSQQKSPEPTQVSNLEDNNRPGSLRYAIKKAPAGSTITFDAKLRGTLLLTSGDLNLAKNLTIRGPRAGMISISSGKSGDRVHVVPGVTVAISGLTFKDSNTSTGFIDNEGRLTLTSSTVSGNTATGDDAGGGITNDGMLTLSNSTVSDNTTTGSTNASGGISNESGGTLTLHNSTISGNMAGPNSTGVGGIYNNGKLMISNSTVSGNRSTVVSGINNDKNGTLMISNSTISGNTAGGGIFNSGMLMISNSTISGNTGSGITNFEATLTLSNSTVSGNTNFCGGGGIDNNGTLTIINSTISGNTAPAQAIHPGSNGCGPNDGSGGGILNETQGMLMLSNSTISGNTANYDGGGILNNAQGTLMLSNITISGNTAGDGGGISNFGTLTLSNSTISGNSAKDGGGVSIQSSIAPDSTRTIAHVDLIFSTIYSNTAHSSSDIAIEDVAFDSNLNSKAITQISQVKIGNSIVTGDPAHPGPDIVGMLTSSGYNLFQDNSGATFDPATNKQHGTDKTLSVNDLSNLFTAPVGLRKNGGPTMTYALAPGSPAIDAIPLQYCQVKDIFNSQLGMYTDQRGVKRPDGNEQFCDSGAYESVDSG